MLSETELQQCSQFRRQNSMLLPTAFWRKGSPTTIFAEILKMSVDLLGIKFKLRLKFKANHKNIIFLFKFLVIDTC